MLESEEHVLMANTPLGEVTVVMQKLQQQIIVRRQKETVVGDEVMHIPTEIDMNIRKLGAIPAANQEIIQILWMLVASLWGKKNMETAEEMQPF